MGLFYAMMCIGILFFAIIVYSGYKLFKTGKYLLLDIRNLKDHVVKSPYTYDLELWKVAPASDCTDRLAAPGYERRETDDPCPLLPRQRHGAEDLSAELDDDPLADGDQEQYDQECPAAPDAVQGRMAGFESLGVEQIPELQEDKRREEDGQLSYGGLSGGVEPPAQHAEQYRHEKGSAGGYHVAS